MYGSDRKRLSGLIKKLRGGRTQRSFAKSIGVSYASIRAWEEYEAMPSVKNLQKIARYSNQSVEELLNYLSGKEDNSSTSDFSIFNCAEDVLPYLKNLPKKELIKLTKILIDKISFFE